MPFCENTAIRRQDAYVLDHCLTIKAKIAFMLNLEIPVAASAIAVEPRLLHRWNLQGKNGNVTVISHLSCKICSPLDKHSLRL